MNPERHVNLARITYIKHCNPITKVNWVFYMTKKNYVLCSSSHWGLHEVYDNGHRKGYEVSRSSYIYLTPLLPDCNLYFLHSATVGADLTWTFRYGSDTRSYKLKGNIAKNKLYHAYHVSIKHKFIKFIF